MREGCQEYLHFWKVTSPGSSPGDLHHTYCCHVSTFGYLFKIKRPGVISDQPDASTSDGAAA